jgi:hypothetical protein
MSKLLLCMEYSVECEIPSFQILNLDKDVTREVIEELFVYYRV